MMRAEEVGDMENNGGKVIHAAEIQGKNQKKTYLLLRQKGDQHFLWFEFRDGSTEEETQIGARTIEEALQAAKKHWKMHSFRMVNCGFRYTLPERDEHGLNALFHQMVASYNSPNGVYFDADIGNNSFVNFASEEARILWKTLKQANKL